MTNDTWKIWTIFYDALGNVIGCEQHRYEYAHKCSAVRRAKQLWGNNPRAKWTVSKTNPWGGTNK